MYGKKGTKGKNQERKKNKSCTDEKDSSNSSKQICRMLTIKIDIPPQKAILPSDVPT